jgi:two-component system cell cycle sensor histidine kinase/response regulator CckA
MPAESKKQATSAWTGYALALVVTAAAFVIRFEVVQVVGVRIPLPLCGLPVVIACIWGAGIGPALFAAVLTTAWYVRETDASSAEAWIQCALYFTETCVVCAGGRQLRMTKDRAAQGEDWRRQLVRTAGEGIWTVDPDGVIGYANPRIAEILGCGLEQVEGRKVDAFLFPEDLPAERIRFQNRRAGVKEQYDRRLRRSDGSEVWTLACSSPYADRNNEAGLLTMMTDITERKKAEHALRRSERKFRELFENILEGVYQTSPDGRILAANPELLRILGFSNHEELNVVGVVRDTFVDTDLHQSLRGRLDRDGSYASVEFQLRTRDHRIVTVRENARVVRDENGGVLYYEGTLTDITEKLRFETQLRRAQEMEALGRLAGGIARDLRGIGGGMMTGLEQAIDLLPADSAARSSLDAVARSMHSAAALTHQILDFSRRQMDGRKGRKENGATLDINALVVGLEPALFRLANPGNLLVLSLCKIPTPVLAGRSQLEQIVTGFVIHARDFGAGVATAKKIELTTAIDAHGPAKSAPATSAPATSATTAGPFVCLSVLRRTVPASPPPSGNEDRPWIGMATSQAILAQYGGTMTAVAEPPTAESGRGVRYSLYLPLASETQPAKTPVNPSVSALPGNAAVIVLLVEEEPLIRELSRDMLERQGFRVLTAGNAAEAERIARGQRSFDVLITEWETGGGKGVTLLQLLREMRPGLRVLFIVGYSDGPLDQIPGRDGSAVLRKPFSGDALGRKVRQLLERSPAAGK